MTGLLIFSGVAIMFTITGLLNLGTKARKLEETDESFLLNELNLAKQECYTIAKQYSDELVIERKRYLDEGNNKGGYSEWITNGVERFFLSKISPKLKDLQRDCLIYFSAYPEIIDQVAKEAPRDI